MPEVRDDPARSRFEVASGGAVTVVGCGRAGDRIVPTRTEVPKALVGKGVGSTLVGGVLDRPRGGDLRVVPRCGFVTAYVERHPEQRDLVAEGG